jgi:hypothetical protein
MTHIDPACFERGCPCHDIETPFVEVVQKREWVGLTKQDVYDLFNKMIAQEGNNIATRYQDFAKYLEARLKEKNT